ncbi:MAG: NfeD family protein [Desulfovibrio sp.]
MDFLNLSSSTFWLMWFAFGAAMIVIEIFSPLFVFVFFGLGAILAGGAALLGATPVIQITIFTISSVLLLLAFRKKFSQVFTGAKEKGEVEGDLGIGELVEVVADINPPHTGRLKFRGSFWDAKSDQSIPAGEMVRIEKRSKTNLNCFEVKKVE